MRTNKHVVLGLLLGVSSAFGCEGMATEGAAGSIAQENAALRGPRARVAVLRNAAGAVVSSVVFTPAGTGKTLVTASVNFPGIRDGFHGYHIHANDNPANGDGCVADPAMPATTHFVSADGHWNPAAATHGDHAGDMPNVMVLEDGSAFLSFLTPIDPLSDVVGRAVILHDGIDNHGNVPVGTAANQYTANSPDAITLTHNTGNAGVRIGCGIIR